MAFFKEAFYLNRNSVADSAMLFVSVSKYSTCPNKSGTQKKPSRFKLDILLIAYILFLNIPAPEYPLINYFSFHSCATILLIYCVTLVTINDIFLIYFQPSLPTQPLPGLSWRGDGWCTLLCWAATQIFMLESSQAWSGTLKVQACENQIRLASCPLSKLCHR